MISGFSVQGKRVKQLVEMLRAKRVDALISLPTQKLGAKPLLSYMSYYMGEEWDMYLCVHIVSCIQTCCYCWGERDQGDNSGEEKLALRNLEINIPETQDY